MQAPLVITVIGEDRPGLVESLARLVATHGGNWLESRMCRLGGQFAGIVRIHIAKGEERLMVQSLQGLTSQGLTVISRPDRFEPEVRPSRLVSLNLVGNDRPGIIHQISAAVARHGINVEELETECSSAPMSGDMIFKAAARLRVPESCVVADLRKKLEEIGGELMVDISLAELEDEG